MELTLTDTEREAAVQLIRQTTWVSKAAHRVALLLSQALIANDLTAEQVRVLADVINGALEAGRINGEGGAVLLPLVDKLEASITEET